MNKFVVTLLSNGSITKHEVTARDESDAAFKAQSELFWGGRVIGVKWIGRN